MYENGNFLLLTIEMMINPLPNESTGDSPFSLNYGHEPVTLIELLRGNEDIKTESVASFIQRVISDWDFARKTLQ